MENVRERRRTQLRGSEVSEVSGGSEGSSSVTRRSSDEQRSDDDSMREAGLLKNQVSLRFEKIHLDQVDHLTARVAA